MKTRLTLTVLLLLIISIFTSSVAITQAVETYQLGVAKGSVFTYSHTITWNSTDASLQIPSVVAALNETTEFTFTITDISGTTFYADVLFKLRSGTTETVSGFADVKSGAINNLPYGDLIVASNLNANDNIYQGMAATINSSVTRTYPSGDRPTNVHIVESTSENQYDKTEVYYDKVKGVAVSSYRVSIDTSGSETEIFTETIICTNVDSWLLLPVPTINATPLPTLGSATSVPTKVPVKTPTSTAPTNSPYTGSPNNPTNLPNNPTDQPGYSVINGTIEPSNDILIIAVIAVVIGVVLVVVLLTVRKRGSRKQKTPKAGKAKKDKDASAENDFDLSGFNLK